MKKLNIKFWAMSLLLTATLASSVLADTEIAGDQFISGRLRVGPDANSTSEPNWSGGTTQANAGGAYSIALGYGANSLGDYSYAIGRGSLAQAYCAISIGYAAQVNGTDSGTTLSAATARGSVSIGQSVIINNADYAIALGKSALIGVDADYSTALGNSTEVSDAVQGGSAIGYDTTVSANFGMALGYKALVTGQYATTLGPNVTAQSFASVVVGRYNTIAGNSTSWIGTDPLFVIGNGTSGSALSNAMVVLKNGNTGIGTDTPTAKLHVDGDIKVTNGTVLTQPRGDLSMGSYTAGPVP